VQRAIRCLVDDGVVVRRKGIGSFVAKNRKTMNDPWHFRFPGDDGESLLPLDIKVRSVESVGTDGPWARFLGLEDSYVQINRLVNVGHEFIILSQFFLSAVRFGSLLNVRAKDLEDAPIRVVLSDRYDTPTLLVVERVGCETLPVRGLPPAWPAFAEHRHGLRDSRLRLPRPAGVLSACLSAGRYPASRRQGDESIAERPFDPWSLSPTRGAEKSR
jgi:hypothetical protein